MYRYSWPGKHFRTVLGTDKKLTKLILIDIPLTATENPAKQLPIEIEKIAF